MIMVECKLMCVSGLGSHVLIDVSLEWRHWLHSPTRQTRHTVVGKSEQKTINEVLITHDASSSNLSSTEL